MTYERWQEIITKVKQKWPNAVVNKEPLPDAVGNCEYIEMQSPLGLMRLELHLKPKVLEKKTLYSHRMNSAATVQYKYDETEQTLTLHAYRWSDAQNDWQEVGAETLAGSL